MNCILMLISVLLKLGLYSMIKSMSGVFMYRSFMSYVMSFVVILNFGLN